MQANPDRCPKLLSDRELALFNRHADGYVDLLDGAAGDSAEASDAPK